jgi:regulator of sigma E protease
MLTVLAIIIVIGGVIFAHELGHFIFARLTGMRVERFSLGFPPRLFGIKIGETDYCISAIPIGGYVKVAGVVDESLDSEGVRNQPWEYSSKKNWQKSLYILGGIIFNLIFAIILFAILTLSRGIYKASLEPVISETIVGMPADSIGVVGGDRVLAVNQRSVQSWMEMTAEIQAHPNDTLLLRWEHQGEILEKALITQSTKAFINGEIHDVGMIGVTPLATHRKASLIEALESGLSNTWYWVHISLASAKLVLSGKESIKNLGGPIMIAQLAGESVKSGLDALLGLIAIISVNLALINFLPIPALDGGHLMVVIIEAIRRKPLSLESKINIQKVGLVIILGLILLTFFNDIMRLIR